MLKSLMKYSFYLLFIASGFAATADSSAPAGPGYTNNSWGSASYTWVADFNGDGRDDIASANGANVYMYLSSGQDFELATWAVSSNWGGAGYTWVDDFTGDGLADIATADGSRITLYVSSGHGFTQYDTTLNNNWGGASYSFSGDFNGDGKSDIASANSGNIYLKISTGTGFTADTWAVPNYNSSFWGGGSYTWVGYFNEDQYQDIATANGKNIRVLLSSGDDFSSKNSVLSGNWGSSAYSWAGDFNNDGVTDIASANSGNVYANINKTDGTFTQHTWTVPNSWGGAGYTFATDLNGDGALGLVSFDSGQAYVNLSTGSQFDSATWTTQNLWGGGSYSWTGDFNSDGYGDVASANGNSIFMHLSTGNRFINQTWFSSKGINQPLVKSSNAMLAKSIETPEDTNVSPASFCQLKYPDDWVKTDDELRQLPMDVSDTTLNVTKLTFGMDLSGMDGLYIFVYKNNGDFVVRRSDRTDDTGYGVKGETQYIYSGNPPYTPSWWKQWRRGEVVESPHQFVRHTQLNHGYNPVFSAGQLQIKDSKIIWVSNASGHFSPPFESLDCVTSFIDRSNIQRTTVNFKKTFDWNKYEVSHHDEL